MALLRDRLKMDVVFVSEFVNGQQVFRYVDAPTGQPIMAPGDASPLEQTWCQRVVDGRIPQLIPNVQAFAGKAELPATPFDIGTYISTPVRLGDGHVYGTLCCLSFSPHESVQERDLKNLKSIAMLVAQKVDRSNAAAKAKNKGKAEPVAFTLMPK